MNLLGGLTTIIAQNLVSELIIAKNGLVSAAGSNENKEKKSTYKKEEYEQKAAELTPKIMELERQNC